MAIGQYGANTLSVSRSLERVLAEFGTLFAREGIEISPDLFVSANYIEMSLRNLTGHLVVGALFVVLVLFLFLFNLRTVILAGAAVSVGSVVGFITLFGITLRNVIMLVSHYRHLVEEEGLPWNADTARKGAVARLSSILMTALVTALAMLPIAIHSDNPGREIMGPMAAIIIGGLTTSTPLNLLILPALMLRFGSFRSAVKHTEL